MATDLQFQILAGIAIALLSGVFGTGVYLVLRRWRRDPRELTPREEAARRAAVRSFVGQRPFMRGDSVLYLHQPWRVERVHRGTLELVHADGTKCTAEARLVTPLRVPPPAERKVEAA